MRVVAAAIGPHGTFSKALSSLPLDSAWRAQALESFSEAVDLRRLHPSDRLELFLNRVQEPVKLRLTVGPFRRYALPLQGRDAQHIKVVPEPVVLKREVVAVSGEVDGSLYAAFAKEGEGARLVAGFAEIFASLIDFNTECQPGDHFNVIVEKYYKEGDFVGYGKILAAAYSGRIGDFQAFAYERDGGLKYYDAEGAEVGTSFLRSPLPFYRVTSRFSKRRWHPVLKHYRPHLGIDLAAPRGTPVMAAADGVVTFAGWKRGFGKTVIIRHHGGIKTYYGHLSRFSKGIRSGVRVSKKQIIGRVGQTGLATGPHLDYRIKVGGRFMNPFDLRFQPKSRLKAGELAHFRQIILPWQEAMRDTKSRVVLYGDEKEVFGRPPYWLG